MDELEQSDLGEDTNDSHNTFYQYEIHYESIFLFFIMYRILIESVMIVVCLFLQITLFKLIH